MKRFVAAVIAMGLVAPISHAQNASTNSSTTPPPIASGSAIDKTSAAPVAGKNSFTKAQARKRLRKNGYSHVTGLAMDQQGVWRGSATKGGNQVSVALDYQGNITEQ